MQLQGLRVEDALKLSLEAERKMADRTDAAIQNAPAPQQDRRRDESCSAHKLPSQRSLLMKAYRRRDILRLVPA